MLGRVRSDTVVGWLQAEKETNPKRHTTCILIQSRICILLFSEKPRLQGRVCFCNPDGIRGPSCERHPPALELAQVPTPASSPLEDSLTSRVGFAGVGSGTHLDGDIVEHRRQSNLCQWARLPDDILTIFFQHSAVCLGYDCIPGLLCDYRTVYSPYQPGYFVGAMAGIMIM